MHVCRRLQSILSKMVYYIVIKLVLEVELVVPGHHHRSLEVEGAESQYQRSSSQGQHLCQQLLGAHL